MLPIYLYKKIMLEKKANSDRRYTKSTKLMEKLANPLPYNTQSLFVSPTMPSGMTTTPIFSTTPLPPPPPEPLPARLGNIQISSMSLPSSGQVPAALPEVPQIGTAKTPPSVGAPMSHWSHTIIPTSHSGGGTSGVRNFAEAQQAASKYSFLEKLKNLSSRVRGGRLKALGILGSLIAGYGTLSMAEPYFVRRLRETAYGGPGIEKIYTSPASDLYQAARSEDADRQAENFFAAVRQRYNQLREGSYAPGVFDKVTGSFQDYEKKRTIFSPIWNALRYLNIFSSHSAPAYEKHYRTPEELVHGLKDYAARLENQLYHDSGFMSEGHYQRARNYLSRLRNLIRHYESELNMGGEGRIGSL
jgi:hypothetical protein